MKKNVLKDEIKRDIESLDKEIQRNPHDHPKWYAKIDALMKLGRHEESFVCYDKAIEINSDADYAWGAKGDVLCKLDRHEESLEFYD